MNKLIEKYIDYLRYEKNSSSHTEISYSNDLQQFDDFLKGQDGEVDLRTVDSDLVRRWIVSLMDSGYTAKTVNRKLSALKSFYRYLLKVGEVADNPIRRLVGPKMPKPIPSFVRSIDMNEVLSESHFDDTFESIRDRSILELFYVTGMRRAELIGLEDVDFDFYAKTVRVTGKRNKQRLIPLSDDTLCLMSEYVDARNQNAPRVSDSFFVRRNGEPLYEMLVYRIVEKALEGIPTLSKTSPHVLRHSFATGMLNNGADINAVKELLGHASLAATEIYTHTSLEELKKLYNQAHPRA